MTGGMAMFQSELRTAVRDAREAPAMQAEPQSQPAQPARANPQVSVLRPKGAGKPTRGDHAASEKRTVVRLWLPLTPLWIILAPFALLLAPALLLFPPLLPNRPGARALRASIAVRPFRTAFALGAVLIAMSGTVVDVDTPDALVRIRIF